MPILPTRNRRLLPTLGLLAGITGLAATGLVAASPGINSYEAAFETNGIPR
jgi:hypothetical protein